MFILLLGVADCTIEHAFADEIGPATARTFGLFINCSLVNEELKHFFVIELLNLSK